MIEDHVERLLERLTGNVTLQRDDDGDWPFHLDRSVMYVGVTREDEPAVNVFASAAHSVPEGEGLFHMLNDMNRVLRFSRAY